MTFDNPFYKYMNFRKQIEESKKPRPLLRDSENMNTEQRDTDDCYHVASLGFCPFKQCDVEAYWKAKEGRCLACSAPIAIQDQYCSECESFLTEMYDKGDQ